jgi:hypothetical protein
LHICVQHGLAWRRCPPQPSKRRLRAGMGRDRQHTSAGRTSAADAARALLKRGRAADLRATHRRLSAAQRRRHGRTWRGRCGSVHPVRGCRGQDAWCPEPQCSPAPRTAPVLHASGGTARAATRGRGGRCATVPWQPYPHARSQRGRSVLARRTPRFAGSARAVPPGQRSARGSQRGTWLHAHGRCAQRAGARRAAAAVARVQSGGRSGAPRCPARWTHQGESSVCLVCVSSNFQPLKSTVHCLVVGVSRPCT